MRTLTLNKCIQGVIIQLDYKDNLDALTWVKRINHKVTIEVEDACNNARFISDGERAYPKYTNRPSCMGMKLLLGRLAKEGKL